MRIKVGATTSQTLPNPPQVDSEDLKRAQQSLKELSYAMPRVGVRVINSAMNSTKTDMAHIIQETYNYRLAVLRKRLKTVKRATVHDIAGTIASEGEVIHLSELAGTTQTARGVSVDVRKDTPRTLLPRAFKAKGRNSGKIIVLRRPSMGGDHASTQNLYPRYGDEGSGGTVTKKGREATLIWFPGPHPEVLYNAPENWARIAKIVAKQIDERTKTELDAEIRRIDGKW